MSLTSMNTSFTFSETHWEWGDIPRCLVASETAPSHAFPRDGVLVRQARPVVYEVDEHQVGVEAVQLPQQIEVRQPVGVLVEAL